jgi:hypothetical protein
VKVRVSSEEYRYLFESDVLSEAIAKQLRATVGREGHVILDVARSSVEPVRAALTEHLAKVGFGVSYEPTAEGRLLESLIDRFFRAAQGGRQTK